MSVKGKDTHALYNWIKNEYGKSPKWNFYKYLFNSNGQLEESWSSITKPDNKKITDLIEKLI
jgi:glutathione peroxidase